MSRQDFSGVEQKERGNYYSKKDLDEARKIHETGSADVIEKNKGILVSTI